MNGGAFCAIDDRALVPDVGDSVEVHLSMRYRLVLASALEGVETAGMRCGKSGWRMQGGGAATAFTLEDPAAIGVCTS